MKTAFLDRDGTIVREHPDEEWPFVSEPEFLDGAIEGLRELRRLGYALIVVTNQCLINEGAITREQYEAFTARMLAVLSAHEVEILDIFFCPHARGEGCGCIKPRPGMIEAALIKHPAIDLAGSFLAGDRPTDIELARRMGLRAFAIGFDPAWSGCKRVSSLGEVAALLAAEEERARRP